MYFLQKDDIMLHFTQFGILRHHWLSMFTFLSKTKIICATRPVPSHGTFYSTPHNSTHLNSDAFDWDLNHTGKRQDFDVSCQWANFPCV